MKAIILAAGRGERMRPLTDALPKPLIAVNGKALIDFHVDTLLRAGVSDLVVNVSWLRELLVTHMQSRSLGATQLHISDEGDVALETGGGIYRALAQLGPEPFWTANGDVYAEFDFAPRELAPTTVAHLLLVPNPAHNDRGDFALAGKQVSNKGEHMYTYSGIALLRPELFEGCEDGVFSLAPLLRRAADAGQVSGELLTGRWCDVGTPERLRTLEASLVGQA